MKEDQLREDQRREALARKEQEAHPEETLPPPPPPALQRIEEVPPPAPRIEEPRIDSKALLESAGLVMIETDRAKAPATTAVEEPAPHLGRPRRERSKELAQADEELQQVETRK